MHCFSLLYSVCRPPCLYMYVKRKDKIRIREKYDTFFYWIISIINLDNIDLLSLSEKDEINIALSYKGWAVKPNNKFFFDVVIRRRLGHGTNVNARIRRADVYLNEKERHTHTNARRIIFRRNTSSYIYKHHTKKEIVNKREKERTLDIANRRNLCKQKTVK